MNKLSNKEYKYIYDRVPRACVDILVLTKKGVLLMNWYFAVVSPSLKSLGESASCKLFCYSAPVDTTFCIVKPEKPFQYQAVRVANWPITHNDWYMNFNDLTEEQQWYIDHADENISTLKQHYMRWLMSI